EPLDSRMSDTTRTVYGNFSSVGRTGESERLARLPWPMSRRDGPRRNFVSPTENGGEVEWGGEVCSVSPPYSSTVWASSAGPRGALTGASGSPRVTGAAPGGRGGGGARGA